MNPDEKAAIIAQAGQELYRRVTDPTAEEAGELTGDVLQILTPILVSKFAKYAKAGELAELESAAAVGQPIVPATRDYFGLGETVSPPVLPRAQIQINRRLGLSKQAAFAQELREAGFDVVGERIYVRTPLGDREMDIITRDQAGRLHGIEIKSGAGTRSPYQLSKDRYINRFGGEAFGERAEIELISGKTIETLTTVFLP